MLGTLALRLRDQERGTGRGEKGRIGVGGSYWIGVLRLSLLCPSLRSGAQSRSLRITMKGDLGSLRLRAFRSPKFFHTLIRTSGFGVEGAVATATANAAVHPQLAAIRQELEEATKQLRRLVAACDADAWARKPSAKAWSAAECVIHLNLTTEMALPLLRKAIEKARTLDRTSAGPYQVDFIGRLVLRFTEPPYRLWAPSPAAFVPAGVEPAASVVARFEELQRQLIEVVEAASGLALTEIKVAWPVYVRVKYNMFASLKILPAHERRHLWQAEQAVGVKRAA